MAIGAARAVPGAQRVVGVDFAGAMLHHGHDKIAAAGLSPRVQLIRGDATVLPVADQSVDALTIAFGIRNVQVTDAACREIRRVLRPGGRVAILEFGLPSVPGLGQLYRWYFRGVLPRIGRLVSRHGGAYSLPAGLGGGVSVWPGVRRPARRGGPGRGHEPAIGAGRRLSVQRAAARSGPMKHEARPIRRV